MNSYEQQQPLTIMSHQLPYLPLSMSQLAESPSFLSDNAAVMRAGIWMLDAAWRSPKPGTISNNLDAIVAITRLSVGDVEKYWDVITAGWSDKAGDGRLHLGWMEELTKSINESDLGPQLAAYADSAAIACQGVDIPFELVSPTEVKKKVRKSQALPKDFNPSEETIRKIREDGYKKDDGTFDWLMQSFRDTAKSKRWIMADWDATLRKFSGNQYTRQEFRAKFHRELGQPMPVYSPASPHFRPIGPHGLVGGSNLTLDQQIAMNARTPPKTFAQIQADQTRATMESAMTRLRPLDTDNMPVPR